MLLQKEQHWRVCSHYTAYAGLAKLTGSASHMWESAALFSLVGAMHIPGWISGRNNGGRSMLVQLGRLNEEMARIYLTRWHHREDMHNGDPCYSSEYSLCYGVLRIYTTMCMRCPRKNEPVNIS